MKFFELTEDSNQQLNEYLIDGQDAIFAYGFEHSKYTSNKTQFSATQIVELFQTLADFDFLNQINLQNVFGYERMQGVKTYSKSGYNPFAYRANNNSVSFPLFGGISNGRYFTVQEEYCSNFKNVVTELKEELNCKIIDNANVPNLFFTQKSYFEPLRRNSFPFKEILLAEFDNNGVKVAEADKLAIIFSQVADYLVNKSSKKIEASGVTNIAKVKACATAMTTIFLCQLYDFGILNTGAMANAKVENALKLQLSMLTASFGDVSRATLDNVSKIAFESTQIYLNNTARTYEDVITAKERMGYKYLVKATDLYEALFAPCVQEKFYYFLKMQNAKPEVEQVTPSTTQTLKVTDVTSSYSLEEQNSAVDLVLNHEGEENNKEVIPMEEKNNQTDTANSQNKFSHKKTFGPKIITREQVEKAYDKLMQRVLEKKISTKTVAVADRPQDFDLIKISDFLDTLSDAKSYLASKYSEEKSFIISLKRTGIKTLSLIAQIEERKADVLNQIFGTQNQIIACSATGETPLQLINRCGYIKRNKIEYKLTERSIIGKQIQAVYEK